ncbi:MULTISPECIES: dynamin family protein [unclassified Acinetobacter]|uniref:dynamin family protein n=1 Tax=unclassified Acinetobacter TaxID=196816 RepID=UPI00190AED54|nr:MULTISPECIES: dynamin family protein [unclassified Acinetobacter]MBK0065053.1 50S ribosome-binding GTPase [Acinetobacter sp. S55]MBK0068233.1 50S ribosome-binding GTPase [Acinetobacter sp. S54]
MTSGGQLQHFIEQTQQITTSQSDLTSILDHLQQWRKHFAKELISIAFEVKGLQPASTLAKQISLINNQVAQQIRLWDVKWSELAAAQSVAEAFSDKVMLLVFGKFNAGKSSLCNLLAECFHRQGQTVRYFYVQNDQIYYTETLLREGATETTAQLQGVCLGERLVLLDTPGLHSATAENAALTQRFIDSADGVLWLSSSTSPGQVQELHALARELKRHKPLFPIITRSDQIEEDELDGEICTILCNKPPSQRSLQEADVKARAEDKLREMAVDVHLLKQPVSVSTQMARQADMDQKAMSDAGFERLFAALLDMIQPALHYKQRKPAEIFLHHLQEQVLEAFVQEIEPDLDQLQLCLHHMQIALLQQQRHIAEDVWRKVLPELPQLLEQYAATRGIDQVYITLTQWLADAFTQQVQQQLVDYQIDDSVQVQLEPNPNIGYELISDLVVHDRLYTELCRQINETVKQCTEQLVHQCEKQLSAIEDNIQQFKDVIVCYSNGLNELASDLRQYPRTSGVDVS